MSRPVLSVIVPAYNEEAVLGVFFDRLMPVLEGLDESFEIIFVDDGSRDRTAEIVRERHAADPRVKLLSFSRNFGKENALTAGLDHATGDAIVPLDADLQDPPELIAQFLEKWREGYDVVYGYRANRDTDTYVKRTTAKMFYKVIRRLAGFELPPDAGDFRLMDRRVVDALGGLREQNRFMKGLFAWIGFRQIGVPYERPQRAAGDTKFGYWRLWNFALDGFTGFTTLPLRMAGYLGFLTALLAVAYGGYLVVRTFVFGADVPGYASIMVAVLLLGGLQLIVLGVIGEYLGRSFNEAKNRPLYVMREALGFEETDAARPAKRIGTVTSRAETIEHPHVRQG